MRTLLIIIAIIMAMMLAFVFIGLIFVIDLIRKRIK